MKAILVFDMPEEASAHNYAVNATEAFCALTDIYQKIRSGTGRPYRIHLCER